MRRLLLILILILIAGHAHALPGFKEIRAAYQKSDALLLDRNGSPLHDLRVDSRGRRLEWVSLSDISPSLISAVIASEDRRFFEHGGVDWTALTAAALTNAVSGSQRGASTITMQLASMLEKSLRPRKAKRSLSQKWDQIGAARELNGLWSKDQILEAYLNLVFFRGELQGVVAASRGLFSKEPSGIDQDEAAILAALIRSPNADSAAVAARACRIIEDRKAGSDCTRIRSLAAEYLNGPYKLSFRHSLAPHVALQLLGHNTRSATSSIEAGLQQFVTETLSYHIKALAAKNVHDGAVLVADNRTGEILAYVANTGISSSARHVDGIAAPRQAGSTLKPFLYALAIEKKELTAASILDDSPINLPTATGLYIPRNYDNEYKGAVSVRYALASSLNIPAVRALILTGTEEFSRQLRKLGFDGIRDGDYYGPSMALGSVDVNLYNLVNAYRTLANGGMWSTMRLQPEKRLPPKKRVISPEAAFIISDILSDRSARSLTFGYENPLSTRFWSAVKTGTSKDMRDNWCIGYSSRYTVGVWVGNFSGSPMWNVSGISGAAPVWMEVMNYLHRRISSAAPKMPQGLVPRQIYLSNSVEAQRTELFIKGTEPSGVAEKKTGQPTMAAVRASIIYPADGTLVAIDPDIPEANNRLFFEASAEGDFIWLLNGKNIGKGRLVLWKPLYGSHRLALTARDGTIIDSVKFIVRGRD